MQNFYFVWLQASKPHNNMKTKFLLFTCIVLLICSCRSNNSVSQVYEIPFPTDEMNAYFDIPYDTVCFASNNGDTIRLEYEKGEFEYTPYIYHGEFNRGEEGPDYEGDEPETEENWGESYGMETYLWRVYYKVLDGSLGKDGRYIEAYISITERADALVDITIHRTLKHSIDYCEKFKLPKPSNDIFKLFKDTMNISSTNELDITNGSVVPNNCNHATLIRGKGVVEFSLNDNTEIWHLVE